MGSLRYSTKPLYGNYQVFSPEDILMFRCDEKRANWYLNKNLAHVLEDPLKIKLNFIPKGLGNQSRKYGLSEMENICVVCGEKEMLNRHHVVPICYRRYFPVEIKGHNFHDVLSLCVDCHEKYERKADELKKILSVKYEAPINGEVEIDKNVYKYTKMASTLLSNINMPTNRYLSMKIDIKSYFNIKRLTKKRLVIIAGMKAISVRRTHGEVVVSKIDDIQSFIEIWRNHFIESNDCKYLPKDWNIKTI